jgi:hypothetical protein
MAASMQKYQVKIIQDAALQNSFEIEAADDLAAVSQAGAHPTPHTIEVWKAEQRIAHLRSLAQAEGI